MNLVETKMSQSSNHQQWSILKLCSCCCPNPQSDADGAESSGDEREKTTNLTKKSLKRPTTTVNRQNKADRRLTDNFETGQSSIEFAYLIDGQQGFMELDGFRQRSGRSKLPSDCRIGVNSAGSIISTYARGSPLSAPSGHPNVTPSVFNFDRNDHQRFQFDEQREVCNGKDDCINHLRHSNTFSDHSPAKLVKHQPKGFIPNDLICSSTSCHTGNWPMRGTVCTNMAACSNTAESTGQWCCPLPVGHHSKISSQQSEAYTYSKSPNNQQKANIDLVLYRQRANTSGSTTSPSCDSNKLPTTRSNESFGATTDKNSLIGTEKRISTDPKIACRSCGKNCNIMRSELAPTNGFERMNDSAPYREENSLQLCIFAAKGLAQKKQFFCEICLDNLISLRTTTKLKSNDECFWGEHFELNRLPKFNKVLVNLYKCSDTKKHWNRNHRNLIGYVEIPIKSISERYPVEQWYPVAIVNGFSKTAVISLRIKARFQTVLVLPLRAYEPLLEYLKTDYLTVCSAVENLTNVKAKEDISTCIVRILHNQNLAKDFLCDLVMREVSALDNYHLLFRGNSLATKAMEAFMKLTGENYLKETLSDFVKTTLASKDVYEVDPSKLANLALLSKHQECLMARAKTIWNKIVLSAHDFPTDLRRVFNELRQRLTSCGSSELADFLISSNIFLRFLCPAIMSPSLFHIVEQYPNDSAVRNLTLIAKTIQTLANFTKFGSKEVYMSFMNKFVEANMDNMRGFLTSISTLNDDYVTIGLESSQKSIDLAKQLSLLHSYLSETWSVPNGHQPQNYSRLKEVVQSIDISLVNAKRWWCMKNGSSPSTWLQSTGRSLSVSVANGDNVAKYCCDKCFGQDRSLSRAESNYDNNNNDQNVCDVVPVVKLGTGYGAWKSYTDPHLLPSAESSGLGSLSSKTLEEQHVVVPDDDLDGRKKYNNRRYTFCVGSKNSLTEPIIDSPLKRLQNATCLESVASPAKYYLNGKLTNGSRCSLANVNATSSGYHSSNYSTSNSNSPVENAICSGCSCRRCATESRILINDKETGHEIYNRALPNRNNLTQTIEVNRLLNQASASTHNSSDDRSLNSKDSKTGPCTKERSPSLLSLPNFLTSVKRSSETVLTRLENQNALTDQESSGSTNRLSYSGASRFFTPPFSRWRQSVTTPMNRSLANSFVTAQSSVSVDANAKDGIDSLPELRLGGENNCKSSSQSVRSFVPIPRTNPRFVVMNGLRNSFKSFTNTLPSALNDFRTSKSRSTIFHPSADDGGGIKEALTREFDLEDEVILRPQNGKHTWSEVVQANPCVVEPSMSDDWSISNEGLIQQESVSDQDSRLKQQRLINAQQARIESLQSANEKLLQTLNDLKIVSKTSTKDPNQSAISLGDDVFDDRAGSSFGNDDLLNMNRHFVSCQEFHTPPKRSVSTYDGSLNDRLYSANDLFESINYPTGSTNNRNSLSCLQSTPNIRSTVNLQVTPHSQVNVSYC